MEAGDRQGCAPDVQAVLTAGTSPSRTCSQCAVSCGIGSTRSSRRGGGSQGPPGRGPGGCGRCQVRVHTGGVVSASDRSRPASGFKTGSSVSGRVHETNTPHTHPRAHTPHTTGSRSGHGCPRWRACRASWMRCRSSTPRSRWGPLGLAQDLHGKPALPMPFMPLSFCGVFSPPSLCYP